MPPGVSWHLTSAGVSGDVAITKARFSPDRYLARLVDAQPSTGESRESSSSSPSGRSPRPLTAQMPLGIGLWVPIHGVNHITRTRFYCYAVVGHLKLISHKMEGE